MKAKTMRYEGRIYRPPSEADSLIVQATVGCSWNHCTYCDMYREKDFRVREVEEVVEEIRAVAAGSGSGGVTKVFVADGDAVVMEVEDWEIILKACRESFPKLKRVSAYVTAMNLLKKHPRQLRRLREAGLSLLYIGPETGDEETFKQIAKGAGFSEHAEAAERARTAGLKLSAIFLLGAGGTERSKQHAEGSAKLITEMDPAFLSLLTLTVVPGTPIHKQEQRGRFTLPSVLGMLAEMRTIVDLARPTNAVFRTNHASNYLPIRGNLPRDRKPILAALEAALNGNVELRPEWARGL